MQLFIIFVNYHNHMDWIIVTINMGKTLVLPNLIYGFDVTQSKSQQSSFADIDKLILKCM